MKKINLLLIAPHSTDATSFYRAWGPFGALRKVHDEINIISGNMNIDWSVLGMVDVAFLQRPFSANHLAIAHMCAERYIPIISDYDDCLFDVPPENPTFDNYSNPDHQQNIREILKLSTKCFTTNEHLKKRLVEESKESESKFVIVPNAFNDFHFKRSERKRKDVSKVVFWRGSKTHVRDLAQYAAEIIEISKKYPDYTFTFLGDDPWFIRYAMNKTQYVTARPMDVYEYFNTIPNIYPLAMQVPLYENKFNKSKSNIAWIEGTFFGSACLVPSWDGWNNPGAYNYSDQASYFAGLESIIENPDLAYEMNKLSWEFIEQNLFLSQVNEKRWEVIKNL